MPINVTKSTERYVNCLGNINIESFSAITKILPCLLRSQSQLDQIVAASFTGSLLVRNFLLTHSTNCLTRKIFYQTFLNPLPNPVLNDWFYWIDYEEPRVLVYTIVKVLNRTIQQYHHPENSTKRNCARGSIHIIYQTAPVFSSLLWKRCRTTDGW